MGLSKDFPFPMISLTRSRGWRSGNYSIREDFHAPRRWHEFSVPDSRRNEHGRLDIRRDRDRVLGARWRHPSREVRSADGADGARLAGTLLLLPGVHRVGAAAACGADARRRRDLAAAKRPKAPSTPARRSPPAWPDG